MSFRRGKSEWEVRGTFFDSADREGEERETVTCCAASSGDKSSISQHQKYFGEITNIDKKIGTQIHVGPKLAILFSYSEHCSTMLPKNRMPTLAGLKAKSLD